MSSIVPKTKKHLSFLKSMSEGHQITASDIQNYKRFDHSDATADAEWKFAPVLVASNRERIDIVHHKTLLFAHHHSTCVFRWQTDVARWQNKPALTNEQHDLQDRDPSFWQQFVAGASGFLTTNLNTNLGLANGTPIVLHSLTFATDEQLQHVRSQIRSLPPGSTITLDEPPLSVNVEIPSTFDTKRKPSFRRQAQLAILKQHSLSKDAIIIPLPVMKSRCKFHSFAVNSLTGIGKVKAKDLFPYELAFAMTVHKAQGRTIPKVVLALAHRDNANIQMKYASIYVALSRVKLASDLRILTHDSGPRPGDLGLKYITHLKHCVHVLDYYAGFDKQTQGGIWNPQASLAAKRLRSTR